MKTHGYTISLAWEDTSGRGTVDYASYSRQFRAVSTGKPPIVGSADPTFRGDAGLVNPEELLVVSLSSCHMLSYLALCALKRLVVLEYRDSATGTMTANHAGGKFDEVVLRPHVLVAPGTDLAAVRALHHEAHDSCYIASSVSFPVRVEAVVEHAVTSA